jgi:hypothetical protein
MENALRKAAPLTVEVRSKKSLKNHIIEVARQCGFELFVHTKFGYDDFTVKTRVKFYRKYRNPPTTKFLVIPNRLVRRLFSIYKRWPELGEFLLRTLIWHEHQHLMQDPMEYETLGEMEEEANQLMVEKMGRPGLVACVWYFYLVRNLGLRGRILNKKKDLRINNAVNEITRFLEQSYRHLISPDEYEDIINDVLWLNAAYQHRLNNLPIG